MPKELDEFYEAIQYYDVGDAVIDNNTVQGYIDEMKKFGQDILDSFKDFCSGKQQARPPKPNGLVRTMSETAFLEPKDVSPLDEVTKPELPVYKRSSNIFKNTSYSVRDLSVLAEYEDKNHNQEIGLRLGDKCGVQYRKNIGSASYTTKIEHNLYNNRTRAEYNIRNPRMSYSASIYHKDGDIGATLSYSNNRGFGVAVSFEGHDKAISTGYTHQFSDCRLSVRGFISTYQQEMDDFQIKNNLCTFGVTGNITM